MEKGEYEINCVAMAIVNFTNETNGVDVSIRQANNEKCFDFAVEKIKDYVKHCTIEIDDIRRRKPKFYFDD